MKHPAIAIALLLLAACGAKEAPVTTSSASAAATTPATAPEPAPEPESRMPAIDACAVLTAGELKSGFGELKEGPTADVGLSKEKLCKYTNMEGNWLQTSLYGSDRWELQKGITSEMHPKALSLGDEAFSVKRGTDSVAFVRKGGGVLEVSCSCDLTKAEALAAKGAARL
jgi:hypothetical protein